ncbi:MAG: hypothetical protein ACR2PG_01215, partial [Hyphomicrobiaceae bacterium]
EQLVEAIALLEDCTSKSCLLRVVHTLKGTGRTLGVEAIWCAAEAVESATDASRGWHILVLRKAIEATYTKLWHMGIVPDRRAEAAG